MPRWLSWSINLLKLPPQSQIMPKPEHVFYSGYKETLSSAIFEKIGGPHWNRKFSMARVLRTNSVTSLKRFRIKSSAVDKLYLLSLVTHLNWPGFLETFMASCSIQQFQVKPRMDTFELKWLSLWQGHRRIPSKIKLHLFTSCFNRANDRKKFVCWGGIKTWLLFRLYGLMSWIWRL